MESFETLYPFHGQRMTLAGGVQMHYLDEGAEASAAVVMLHGNPTWSFFYRDLVKALAPRTRCIVPDHIGMGYSDKPQDYPYTLRKHIDNLEALLEASLPPDARIVLVMHDWGGAIGMGWAVRHPERVAGLVVMNTAAFLSSSIPFRIDICRIPLLGALAIRGGNLFARAALRMATTQPGGLQGAVAAGYLKPYDSWANRIGTLRFVQDIPMHPGVPSYHALSVIQERLPLLLHVPVHIEWGARDFCFHLRFLEAWQGHFPHATVRVHAGAGHYLLEDAGAEVVPAVTAFVRRCMAETRAEG